MDLESVRLIKIAFSLGLAAALIGWTIHRPLKEKPKQSRMVLYRVLAILLGISLCALAMAAYFDFGIYTKFGRFSNPHDSYHYYMGAKYSSELGYLQLYPCTLLADAENHNGVAQHTKMRRLDNYKFVDSNWVKNRADRFCKRFSPERWQEFKTDTEYFHTLFLPNRERRWRSILEDKGYNGTPVWNALFGFVVNHVDVKNLGAITSVDLALIAFSACIIAWAFGPWAAVLFLSFFCISYPMSFTHIRGGLLRLDWLFGLIASVCLLKKEHYAVSGVAVAYAVGSRVFPAAFLVGLAACTINEFFLPERKMRKHLQFWISFSIAFLCLIAVSFLQDGAVRLYQQYIGKIAIHDAGLSPMRVGLKYALLGSFFGPTGSWSVFATKAHSLLSIYGWLWWVIRLGLLGAIAWSVRKCPMYIAAALGYCALTVFFAPTFYYHVCLIVPMIVVFEKREHLSWSVAGVIIFAGNALLNYLAIERYIDRLSSYVFSLISLVFALALLYAAHRSAVCDQSDSGSSPLL